MEGQLFETELLNSVSELSKNILLLTEEIKKLGERVGLLEGQIKRIIT